MSAPSFLGIQIEGDITRGSKKTAQRPLSDLEPLIRAVLNDELIHSFGWTQYTPYFNDGEPCEFDVNEVWFKTVHDAKPKANEDDEEDYEDRDRFNVMYGTHPTLGRRDYEWNNTHDGQRLKVWKDYEGQHEQTWMNCYALAEAIGTEAFDDVLLEAFGDHAEIEITRDGIKVDTYEHD
jgi:hypothetical protein